MSSSSMVSAAPEVEMRVSRVLFTMRWRLMSQILLALPVVGMFICLITSIIFHSDHINNTICKVYNFLPSISAVTGVSPQRYLWRVAVALHISPRLLVAWVAKAYYTSLAAQVPAARRPAYLTLVSVAFYLNLTELATLCGVTYISNKENYPVHEKLFTLFMLVSLVYMLCVIRVMRAVRHTLTPALLYSFNQKKWLFGIKLGSTGGLLFFFWRHRVFCQPMAFSWFSLCEYIIATCNMLYHVSVALDFADEYLIVGHIIPATATPPTASLVTTASSSPRQSPSTSSTTCDSLATCEGTPDGAPPTKNGRLDDTLADGGPGTGVGGPGAMFGAARANHVPLACGAALEARTDAGVAVCGAGPSSGALEGEAPPAVVHQVLNTIHEGAEPPPCLNGLDQKVSSVVVQRRPPPSNPPASPPTDTPPPARPHSE